jgi:hypothetical protein
MPAEARMVDRRFGWGGLFAGERRFFFLAVFGVSDMCMLLFLANHPRNFDNGIDPAQDDRVPKARQGF